jgi:NTE family protein
VPIAPTFRSLTDVTIAVNLNADPLPHSGAADPFSDDDEPEDDLRSRIRQFLDDIGETLRPSDERDLSVLELMSRSFETMQNAIAGLKLAAYSPDVVINVPRDVCEAHEFHRARELIDTGYRLAEQTVTRRLGGTP